MSKEIADCGLWIVDCTQDTSVEEWPALPTETEIYILPDGEIVVADLPVELIDLIEQLNTKFSATETTVS